MKRFKVLIVIIILCLFSCIVITLIRVSFPEQEIVTIYSQTQVQVSDLKTELIQPYFPKDPNLFRVDLERLELLPEKQTLYRQEVTKNYGTFFSVSFVAFFADPLCSDCVTVYLCPIPGKLNPTLVPISSIVTYYEPTQRDFLLFCRYQLSGTYQSSAQGVHLEKLTHPEEKQIFQVESGYFSGTDTILVHKNDFICVDNQP